MKKFICLLLVFCTLCASLIACDDGADGTDGGNLVNGDWSTLNFGDATLTVSVSKNQSRETTFQASAVYMRGPDNAATSEPVQKKVLERNKKVAEDLDMTIAYQETNWKYSEILPHLEQLVAGDAADAPDVYNNDMYALFRGMMNGYLWNVTNPGKDARGNEVKSYFDFDHECWYQAYMQGATFSKDKQYILVGDYNIDIVRWAWVLFVNVDLWDSTFSSFTESNSYYTLRTYESACLFVEGTHEWFYDDLITLAGIAHRDGASGTKDKTEENDDQIGFAHNACSSRLFTYGSGHSIFEWTKNGKAVGECEGTPSMITDTTDLVNVGLKFTELYNAKGVFHFVEERENPNLETVKHFMKGKTVMATAALGEMESSEMRATNFKRGVLPYPRYSNEISDLTTIVHDQAEVSVILNNAKSFALASAYLQYVNEESTEILDFYYEDVLKFKYNESRGARKMIDLITEQVTTPFEALMNLYLFDEAGVDALLHTFARDAKKNSGTTIRSTYDSARGTLQTKLDELYAKFNALE